MKSKSGSRFQPYSACSLYKSGPVDKVYCRALWIRSIAGPIGTLRYMTNVPVVPEDHIFRPLFEILCGCCVLFCVWEIRGKIPGDVYLDVCSK